MSVNILTQNGLQRIHTVRVQKDSKIIESDVNFYDYDGTLVNSYTKTEFLALSALPPNPSHNGLTAQGWNWSLSDAKSYVNDYGKLNVGQMYITSDGKTRLNPELNLTFVESGSFTVDWGDGTAIDTVSGEADTFGTKTHAYPNGGDYIITITVISGILSIEGKMTSSYSYLLKKANFTVEAENKVYNNCIKSIEIGNNIKIGRYAFRDCRSLVSVMIPNQITELGMEALSYCYSLVLVIIPNSITRLNSYVFQYSTGLTTVSLPSNLTEIGSYTLRGCISLMSITIPNSVTTIGREVLNGCNLLNCITIPNEITNLPSYFLGGCYTLETVTIPEDVTSIEGNVMSGLYSLSSITIPDEVTSIGKESFSGCQGLGRITFKRETPPTIASDTFKYLPTDCVIYVPRGSRSAYTSAQYYPNPNTYLYIEY